MPSSTFCCADLAVNLGDSRKFLFRKVQQILNKAVSTGPAISVNAPYGSEHVSFQKVVVPLLATLVKVRPREILFA